MATERRADASQPRPKSPRREQFEVQRRRMAFYAALPAIFAGIIAGDTWVHPQAGLLIGPLCGAFAYGVTYGYDTWMWHRHGGEADPHHG